MLKKAKAVLRKITGSGRVDKMWAGALAPAIVKGLASLLGVEFSPELELVLLSLITGGAVWTIPNAPAPKGKSK